MQRLPGGAKLIGAHHEPATHRFAWEEAGKGGDT